MKSKSCLIPALLLGVTCALAPMPALGQDRPIISVSGEKTIKRLPTELVMRIELVGRDETLDEALQAVAKRKEAAGLLLKSLGANMETVEFGDPTTSNASNQGQQQMEAMIRRRMGRIDGPIPEGLKIAEASTVTLPLKARWKLTATDATGILKEATELRKKIEEADLAGVKSNEASLAEQELIEESESLGFDPYSEEPQAKPGTPVFSYATKITPDDRSQALKEAFEMARANAEELANAANRKLGPLSGLHSSSTAGPSQEMMYGYNYRRGMPSMEDNDPLTAETPQLGKLTFQFILQASFRLAD